MDTYINGAEASGSFFISKNGLENDQFEEMFMWGDIDPIDDWRCGVKEQDFDMPPAAVAK